MYLVGFSFFLSQVETLGFKLARLEASYAEVKAQCEEHAQVGTSVYLFQAFAALVCSRHIKAISPICAYVARVHFEVLGTYRCTTIE